MRIGFGTAKYYCTKYCTPHGENQELKIASKMVISFITLWSTAAFSIDVTSFWVFSYFNFLPYQKWLFNITLEVEWCRFGYLWGWSLCDFWQEVLAVDALTSWTTGLSTVSAPTLLCLAWISFAFAPFSQLAHFVSYGHDVLIGVPVKSVPMLIFYPPMVFWWQQIDVFGSCLCPHVDYPNCPLPL